MTFRWPWEPTPPVKCTDCSVKEGQLRLAWAQTSELRLRLDASEEERKQLLAALTMSFQPQPMLWPAATDEQKAAREQKDLKRMFEEKAVKEYPGI